MGFQGMELEFEEPNAPSISRRNSLGNSEECARDFPVTKIENELILSPSIQTKKVLVFRSEFKKRLHVE